VQLFVYKKYTFVCSDVDLI